MIECNICGLIKEKKGLVYKSDKVIALMHPKPASPGHIIVLPKKHHAILEDIPDFVMPELFSVANKFSIIAFQLLQSQGTNIMIQNGVAAGQKSSHCMIHVIPRKKNDGLQLLWEPKQASPEEINDAEEKLLEQTKLIGFFEEEKQEKVIEKKEEETEDYLEKELERLP
ncbi:HIT family protein [Candidatus Woesearchaeota archaeon]|nr:HIT family protein [Candidatus Woesearchaeota archaeon]